ncbi:SAM-dependent methyltransferase [Thiolapillus sp.]|uniref:SAM-dependent methyltransferase n=1 Tax=Thiolapillus sp. TaxID=2017437 RepID=UPI0025EB351E|nr:SAM-dependent methyltransferase [Thiolapillus sp.]
MPAGSLVIVGSGIQLGRHISARSISEIEQADKVFCMTDAFTYRWIEGIRPDLQPLHIYYGDEKDRRQTYREMETAIVSAVKEGHKVCAVFYGHPGVFADVPHAAVRKLRAEGYSTRMEPGISAEDCLVADLGMDPGKHGCTSMEATQFLVYERQIDPTAMLILWQIGLTGDLSCTRFDTTADKLQVLVDKLCRWYPVGHRVTIYEAPVLAIHQPRADRLSLKDLPLASLGQSSTLIIPPAETLSPDTPVLRALGYTLADLD